MTRAQAIQAEQADKYCSNGEAVNKGDFVWMSARNIETQWPS
jgi:citrate lyase alpha subunit